MDMARLVYLKHKHTLPVSRLSRVIIGDLEVKSNRRLSLPTGSSGTGLPPLSPSVPQSHTTSLTHTQHTHACARLHALTLEFLTLSQPTDVLVATGECVQPLLGTQGQRANCVVPTVVKIKVASLDKGRQITYYPP